MSYQIIGKITGFKGLKGEMKVKPLSGFIMERLSNGGTIYLKIGGQYQSFNIKSYHEKQKYPLLILDGYDRIEQVEKFKNLDIFVEDDQMIELPEDTYHQDELLGLKVYQNKVLMGKVIDILNYPQYDYLLVETKEKNVMIPFMDEFIVSMDDESINIVDMEGLF